MVVLLEPVAGVAVANRQREEDQTHGQHDDVEHRLLPFKFAGATLQVGFGR